ncbi:MAG: DUF29 domain-containing protein [Symploca sp. SIO3E6]|nr:DUF29 domain-containing protein [Caldora sp. SIO3E6]
MQQTLVMNLLKWQFQPEKQSTSWLGTIQHQRDEIEALLMDSPSLRGQLEPGLEMIYPKAVRDASRETDLPETAFPLSSPLEIEKILDQSFLPD